MSIVKWLPIPGIPGYEASNDGRVRSCGRRGKVLCAYVHPTHGYHTIHAPVDGKSQTLGVHRLVCMAFHGSPTAEAPVVRHLNGDPGDNRPENLKWGTVSENGIDCVAHGTHVQANKTHCVHGHEFTPENTRVGRSNRRACRACDRRRQAEAKVRKLARIRQAS